MQSLLIKKIVQHITDHRQNLEMESPHYLEWLGKTDRDDISVAEAIMEARDDSREFNIGHEQGYLSGMYEILNLVKIPLIFCVRCIEDYEDEEGHECKGTQVLAACPECFVCADCEHLSDCSKSK